MERAFVIRPFGIKKDSSDRQVDFERVHEDLIGPALRAAGLHGGTTGEVVEAGNIRESMFSLILEGDLAICDVTIHNANVFYELGIRHALRRRSTILIRGEPSDDTIPFDLLTDRYLKYDVADPAASLDRLVTMIQATLRTDQRTDSPVFRMMEGLAEADPASVEVVPPDFREEVERARAAGSLGWLRLLADDVRGQRFQWTGLKLIAAAQWALRDYEGARASLEKIPSGQADAATHLTLANLYERLYRDSRKPELLTSSDQAIRRVLADPAASRDDQVEAHTLKARNAKTRWREEFEALADPAARREIAMNQRLRDTYEAYRAAYDQDLNRFYPGLAALQMGMVFLHLSSDPDGSWKNAFHTDARAAAYRTRVEEETSTLRLMVDRAIHAQLDRLDRAHPDRVWAEVSEADLLFLYGSDERVMRWYRSAIPPSHLFAWDAARGQLSLFAALGFREELAKAVIQAIDGQKTASQDPEDRPLHLVAFVGHRVDEPGRTPPRFPEEHASRAAERMREKLRELMDGHRVVALASGAPGGDILFHEVCDELGIPCTMCLPMPVDDYSFQVFGNQDGWRGRFLNLHRARKKDAVLELSNTTELPRWLQGTNANPWERGNRWVLKMMVTSGADFVTLVALWDGREHGGAPGGTAHMVHISRQAGTVDVKRIDTNELLAPPPYSDGVAETPGASNSRGRRRAARAPQNENGSVNSRPRRAGPASTPDVAPPKNPASNRARAGRGSRRRTSGDGTTG